MADQRTMAELLRAPNKGYAEAIVITSTLKYKDVPETSIKLMLFPFFIDGPARIWLDKEPSHSILTWDDLDRFKDLLRAYPHHGFTELHQLDTFYNGLNSSDQDSLNFAAGGNLLERKIASAVASVVTSSMTAMFKQHQVTPAPASVKVVEESCVTCGGAHSYRQCPATDGNTFSGYQDNIQGYVSAAAVNYNQRNTSYRPQSFFQMNTASSSGSGSLPRNTVANPRGDLKAITTRSGISYDGPLIPPPLSSLPKVVEWEPESVVAPKPKPSIPYPSRANKQKLREKDDLLASKFVEIVRELHFELSFADAYLHMPKFTSMFKSLLNNKEKLFDLTKTPVNENCSAIILKKLPEKLGYPGKFLIPCDFSKLVECLTLVDLGASIKLMPLSIWKKLSLPELTPTQMILELADRSTTSPSDIAEDVFVKVGKFHFLANFVVVDYVVDPRVPLILGRPFLRMARALIDFYEWQSHSVFRSYPFYLFPSLTPFEEGDFILEEIEACLTNDSIPPGIDDDDFDLEGDLLLLEKLLNDDPSSPLPMKELHVEELKIVKSSIDDHPGLELKDLPSYLKYAFLEGTDKLPVIIAKDLKEDEKVRLLKVLKSHKRAITWKISNIKGIDPQFCNHKILMEDDSKSEIQHQRRVNQKIHEVIKKEVIKLLDAKLIYPISDSPWLSPVHCVPKKGGMTVIENEDNELIPTRLVMGWHMVSQDIFKFQLTRKTKRKPPSLALMERLPTDACLSAYVMLQAHSKGAVLGQRKTKHFQPMHYASKTMMDAQAHYTTTEKELLAVVYAFEKFRPYLVLSKTIVYTDHSALKYLLAKQDAKQRLLRERRSVGSISGVGEEKVEFMEGIGGGSFSNRSMVAKDGLEGDGFVVDGGR
ncbi:reverse transcriptase domain-containing protein [Tanacetum coccineum]